MVEGISKRGNVGSPIIGRISESEIPLAKDTKMNKRK
jgi:hypothetical protein